MNTALTAPTRGFFVPARFACRRSAAQAAGSRGVAT